ARPCAAATTGPRDGPRCIWSPPSPPTAIWFSDKRRSTPIDRTSPILGRSTNEGTIIRKVASVSAEAWQETPERPVAAAHAHEFPAGLTRRSRHREPEKQVDDKDHPADDPATFIPQKNPDGPSSQTCFPRIRSGPVHQVRGTRRCRRRPAQVSQRSWSRR